MQLLLICVENNVRGPAPNTVLSPQSWRIGDVDLDRDEVRFDCLGNIFSREDVFFQAPAGRTLVVPEVEQYEFVVLLCLTNGRFKIRPPAERIRSNRMPAGTDSNQKEDVKAAREELHIGLN